MKLSNESKKYIEKMADDLDKYMIKKMVTEYQRHKLQQEMLEEKRKNYLQ